MKALTLTQPWATLMALRAKTIETRSWWTSYRGELVIHAAKGFPKWAREICDEPEFAEALSGWDAGSLPLSMGLCIVRLVECVPTQDVKPSTKELCFGDYTFGHYAWLTEYVMPLPPGEPVRGALGLWEYPSGLVRL